MIPSQSITKRNSDYLGFFFDNSKKESTEEKQITELAKTIITLDNKTYEQNIDIKHTNIADGEIILRISIIALSLICLASIVVCPYLSISMLFAHSTLTPLFNLINATMLFPFSLFLPEIAFYGSILLYNEIEKHPIPHHLSSQDKNKLALDIEALKYRKNDLSTKILKNNSHKELLNMMEEVLKEKASNNSDPQMAEVLNKALDQLEVVRQELLNREFLLSQKTA